MAGTGILIAAHGAALVNAMFLPQHAVVIEMFPYYLKKMTYVAWAWSRQFKIASTCPLSPTLLLQICASLGYLWALLLSRLHLDE